MINWYVNDGLMTAAYFVWKVFVVACALGALFDLIAWLFWNR